MVERAARVRSRIAEVKEVKGDVSVPYAAHRKRGEAVTSTRLFMPGLQSPPPVSSMPRPFGLTGFHVAIACVLTHLREVVHAR